MLTIWLISWMFPRSLQLIGGVRLHEHDALPDAREDDDEEENQYEVASQQAADDALQDWELLGARLPNNDAARDEDPDDIGNREFDHIYDWSIHVDRYADITANYWDGLRDTHSDQLMPLVVGSADALQPEQSGSRPNRLFCAPPSAR
ncbi:hypothetical protein V8E54_009911 [Elaphomyces granulatus]